MLDYKNKIISIFELLGLYYEIINDIYRMKAYKNIVDILKNYYKPIYTIDDIPKKYGIGKKSIQKIIRIINGDTLENFIPPNQIKILNAFNQLINIRGVGKKKAIEWIQKYNITSINKLKQKIKNNIIILNRTQKLGLKYYNDLNTKISNKEIKRIEKLFKKIIKKINPKFKIDILGSYRRKLKLSRDIDILLTHPNIKTKKQLKNSIIYIKKFIKKLYHLNIIVDKLKTGSLKQFKNNKHSITLEYLIKTKYSNCIRKIDIKFYPYKSYPTALMYFTGSKNFNRRIREIFKQNGYLLSDYGLFQYINSSKIKRINVQNEKDIFDIIKLEYVPPEKRTH
jgi:DNA polymerase/3'-5' exonuclease PolX